MLDRIVSERIDVNKASQWKEYDICYYWHFLEDVSTVCLQWVSWCINDAY